MSQMFREKSQVSSKRYTQQITPPPLHHLLNSPFSSAAVSLSDSELRESAYEILIAACRSSGTRPLTYISQSEKASSDKTHNASNQAAPSLQRSLTSSAASKVKKALGMKSRSVKQRANCEGGESVSLKKSVTVGELVRAQMRVTEQTDSRIRRALLRIAAGQLGRRMETMVLPLELLQQLKPSDFPNPQDYVAWQRRTLKLLEAGLLLHPRQPLDRTDDAPRRLQQIIRGALEKPIDVMKNMELMQNLRSVVTSVACRSFDGSVSDFCHWADSFPLNMRIYQLLLEGCFDVNDESVVIEEIDEVLELIKKTWTMLGMSQMLHNLCFLWVLFHHYVATGQVEDDLIFAANNLLLEVEKDEASKNPDYFRTLSSILSPILNWAETRLNAYHNSFHSDNTECMEIVASLAVTAAKLLVDDTSHNHQRRKEADVPRDRIDAYIRSSLRTAFTQKLDKLTSSKNLPRKQPMLLPSLAILADDISQLAFREKAIFSPILKTWHPLAAGVAVATLHYCYGIELKEFVSSISELSPDVIQVLTAADKLEKDLVQIAVEDAVDSEDGGKSIIQEMPPYEAESIIANLVKSWITLRVDRFKEWVDRNLQLETWNPLANKERFAPSAVEVLRVIDETLEAFFLLPIPIHSVVLPYLVTGLDKCLQNYVLKAKSGCESPRGFMPALPALTRCTTGSKFHVFKKKDKVHLNQNRKSQVGNVSQDSQFGIPQLCVRVNTLHHIRTQMEVLEKRTGIQLRKSESASKNDFANGRLKKFELSAAACVEGTQQLCEATAYKVVFHDLDHVLWNGLYIGEVSSSRIDPFLQELEQYLEIIASTVHDRVRTRLITDVMRASFDGFLLVLLAGGPSRAFTIQDYEAIEEDFKLLKDLFWSNGDGLPTELIDKFSVRVKGVLPLFHTDTENLVAQFKSLVLENEGSSAKSKLPLPPTSGQWSPTEPNTVLRILCHRKDEIASKFLKKTYNLPKKL